eukprot:1178184-Prorocentrum_minimum.AAC.11
MLCNHWQALKGVMFSTRNYRKRRRRSLGAGIFSRRTNQTQEAQVYSHDGPIRRRKHRYILTTDQSRASGQRRRRRQRGRGCVTALAEPSIRPSSFSNGLEIKERRLRRGSRLQVPIGQRDTQAEVSLGSIGAQRVHSPWDKRVVLDSACERFRNGNEKCERDDTEAVDRITWAVGGYVEAAVDGLRAARPWCPLCSLQQCRRWETSCTQFTHTTLAQTEQ